MSNYTRTASLLDSLTIGMCVFDAQDRTVLWSEHFLRFFPEHADHIHSGEPYQQNLRRFYRVRLPAEPQASIDRYVQHGIKRHRSQVGAYMFTHRGRQLRVWQDLSAMESVLLNLAGQQDSVLPQGGARRASRRCGCLTSSAMAWPSTASKVVSFLPMIVFWRSTVCARRGVVA